MQKTANGGLYFHVGAQLRVRHASWLPAQMMRIMKPTHGRFHRSIMKKLLITMKLLTLFLFIACLSAAAGGNGQSVSIAGKAMTYQQLFSAIKEQTGYVVLYDPALLSNKPTAVAVRDLPLRAFLDMILSDQSVEYDIQDKTIFISKQLKVDKVGWPDIPALQPPVQMRVMDADGKPLAGATITVKKTNRSGVTDVEGVVRLNLEVGDVVVVSFVGMERKFITITPSILQAAVLDISLDLSDSKLDDVVVIAYGETTKRLNTASISTVTAAEIEKQPITNLLSALAGNVTGMKIAQQDGLAGGTFDIQIRGKNSLTQGSRPLILIDGIPFTNESMSTSFPGTNYESSPLNIINPGDIERIDVLKDADATAIYGSRGGNGVILITTKKGQIGKPALNMNVYTGLTKSTVVNQFMNTQQYIEMRQEAFRNDGITPTALNAPDLVLWDQNRYIDWNKEFRMDHAPTSNAQVDLSGGTIETQYLISASFHKEKPLYANLTKELMGRDFDYQKGSVKFSLNNNLLDGRIKTGLTAAYSMDHSVYAGGGVAGSAGMVFLPPNAPYPLDQDGNIVWRENGAKFVNPLAIYNSTFDAQNRALTASFNLTANIARGFDFKINAGYNTILYHDVRSNPSTSLDPDGWRKAYTHFYRKEHNSWQVEPILTYQNQWGPGKLEVLTGMSWHTQNGAALRQDVGDQSDDKYVGTMMGSPYSIITYLTNTLYTYHGMYSRLNYNIDNKYIINLTARRDGSSRFGPGRRYSNFGAVGLAYIFTEESLIKEKLPFLSFGKFRTNYGVTGNDNIGEYMFYDSWGPFGNSYSGSEITAPMRLSNADYNWERNNKFETAMELGFLNNRLMVTVNFYRSIAGNQLIDYSLPSQTGFNSVLKNFEAKILNQGLEWTLTAHPIQYKDFSWTISFNATTAENKLKEFPDLEKTSYASRFIIDKSITGSNYYPFKEIDPNTGMYTYVGTTTAARTIRLDNRVPRFYGGLTNSIQWKQFSADILLQYVVQNGQDALMRISYAPGTMYNQPVQLLDRWQEKGDDAKYQRYTTAGAANTAFSQYKSSDAYIVDASFIRIKNISLAYNFTSEINKLMKVKALRVYMQGNNLGLFTKYKGADPESGGFGNPLIRVYTAGLQLTF